MPVRSAQLCAFSLCDASTRNRKAAQSLYFIGLLLADAVLYQQIYQHLDLQLYKMRRFAVLNRRPHMQSCAMNQLDRERITALLARAEEQAPTDPEAAIAAQLFRSALEPPKPRDLFRDELQGKLGEYAFSIVMDDAKAGQLADDIRKCLASQGLEPPAIN